MTQNMHWCQTIRDFDRFINFTCQSKADYNHDDSRKGFNLKIQIH